MYSFLKWSFWILIVVLFYVSTLIFDILDKSEYYENKKTYKKTVVIVFVVSIFAIIGCIYAQNKMPYKQEFYALTENTQKLNKAFYRDGEEYFMIHKYKVSEDDFKKNGWKYVRLDFEESHLDDSMMRFHEDSKSHYKSLRYHEATHNVYRLCCNLYKNESGYFILKEVASSDIILGFNYTLVEITESEANEYIEIARLPGHDCLAHGY